MTHVDIRTHTERRRGWWIEPRATIPNALPRDGLIIVFRRQDAEHILDATYPYSGTDQRKVWYFNTTRDREIAEIDANNRICANPQVLYKLFWAAK